MSSIKPPPLVYFAYLSSMATFVLVSTGKLRLTPGKALGVLVLTHGCWLAWQVIDAWLIFKKSQPLMDETSVRAWLARRRAQEEARKHEEILRMLRHTNEKLLEELQRREDDVDDEDAEEAMGTMDME